jgi:hypothetical protein
MGYKKAADGITKKGKTDAKVFPNSGPSVVDKGPKKSTSMMNKNLKLMGRGLAKVANQKKAGRGR